MEVQPSQARKLISSSVSSAARVTEDRIGSSRALDNSEVRSRLAQATNPRTLSGGMKKLGIALVAAPDPITGIPGVALLVSSVAVKRREPVGVAHLAKETRKILREMESLRI